jgi:EAL domain-containing protein (putative c-di-GMP-specific phosphodiesterase class I)
MEFDKKGYGVFNLGGDEFLILLKEVVSQKELEDFAAKLLGTLSTPFIIEEIELNVTASAGIVIYPDHGNNFVELYKNVDLAMYQAKQNCKGKYAFFDESMGNEARERSRMLSCIRNGIENSEFLLYYQPILNLKAKKVQGFEALIRWNSPQLGFVSPMNFMKAAEESHLVVPIGKWVLKTACSFLKNIHMQGYENYNISVNVSVIQLLQEDFVDTVLSILKDTGLEPRYLELEITESVLMNSYDSIIEKLKRFKFYGISIALDDFGTGYSSLSYLRQLPISTLKIDKSFIDSVSISKRNKTLTGAIISMGHGLGLKVVAEGVETLEQLTSIDKLKCDRAQGYLISKPVPGEELIKLLENKDIMISRLSIREEATPGQYVVGYM